MRCEAVVSLFSCSRYRVVVYDEFLAIARGRPAETVPAAVPRAIPVRAGGYVCANYSRFYCNVEEAESLHGKYMASYIETVKISDRPPKLPKQSIQTNAKKRDGSIHIARARRTHTASASSSAPPTIKRARCPSRQSRRDSFAGTRRAASSC